MCGVNIKGLSTRLKKQPWAEDHQDTTWDMSNRPWPHFCFGIVLSYFYTYLHLLYSYICALSYFVLQLLHNKFPWNKKRSILSYLGPTISPRREILLKMPYLQPSSPPVKIWIFMFPWRGCIVWRLWIVAWNWNVKVCSCCASNSKMSYYYGNLSITSGVQRLQVLPKVSSAVRPQMGCRYKVIPKRTTESVSQRECTCWLLALFDIKLLSVRTPTLNTCFLNSCLFHKVTWRWHMYRVTIQYSTMWAFFTSPYLQVSERKNTGTAYKLRTEIRICNVTDLAHKHSPTTTGTWIQSTTAVLACGLVGGSVKHINRT